MNRRTFVVSTMATPTLSACFWDKHFDLKWEEEVQLHDGRVMIVKLKYTYERISTSGFTRYENAIPRDTELSFDAAGKDGAITQLIKGFHPMLLDEKDGIWYMVMYGSHYGHSDRIPGQNWGSAETADGNRAASLQSGQFKPISLRELPDVFDRPNVLMLYGGADDHAKFDGTRVTLAQKMMFHTKHPLGLGHVRIDRPLPGYPKPSAPIADKIQGVPK